MTNVVLKKTGEGRNSRGEITVWERPREGAEYIIGADVAQGATFGTAKRDADKSTICVLRRDGMLVHHVAEAVYQTENFSFGQVIAALGQWYNNAWVNVERNLAHGVIAGLRVAQYPTERWYIPPISASTAESQAGSYFFHKNVSTQKVLLDTLLAYMDPHAPRLVMRSARQCQIPASHPASTPGTLPSHPPDHVTRPAMQGPCGLHAYNVRSRETPHSSPANRFRHRSQPQCGSHGRERPSSSSSCPSAGSSASTAPRMAVAHHAPLAQVGRSQDQSEPPTARCVLDGQSSFAIRTV